MMNHAANGASGLKSTHLLQLWVVEFEAEQSISFGGEASVLVATTISLHTLKCVGSI